MDQSTDLDNTVLLIFLRNELRMRRIRIKAFDRKAMLDLKIRIAAKPFDLLIIMLGSNDLKAKFHLPAGDIAGSLQNMLMKINYGLK